jgi:hypothetical protein
MTESNQRSWGGNGAFTSLYSLLDFHTIATPNPVIRRSERIQKRKEAKQELRMLVFITFYSF